MADQTTVRPLDRKVLQAFADISADDPVAKLIAWHRLERAGFADADANHRSIRFRFNRKGKAQVRAIKEVADAER